MFLDTFYYFFARKDNKQLTCIAFQKVATFSHKKGKLDLT